MDHLNSLPISKGHDAILFVVDRFSKIAHSVPAKATNTAADLASQFLSNFLRIHELPADIVLDRGTTFSSQFWKEAFRLTNITPMFSNALHPQINGRTKRINQALEQHLRTYSTQFQDNWYQLLDLAEFTYNNTENSSIQHTLFFTCYGYRPNFEITLVDFHPHLRRFCLPTAVFS